MISVPAVAAGRDHGGRRQALGELRDRARPRLRGIGAGEDLVLGDVHGGDAVRAERAGRLGGAGAGDHGVHRLAARVAAREGERLQGELVGLAALVLDEDEDHHATPSRRRTSTTAGAAAGPSPSSSAWRPGPDGTVRRTSSTRGARASGSALSIGLRRARSLAGTDG